jgi:heme-degrading monooxygenase HmoA
MTIARVILINDPGDKPETAERIWKTQCAPLMTRQKGCLVEKLMHSLDRPELYISYSEWESLDAIEEYRKTTEHDTIKSEIRALQGARAVVWVYEIME